MSPTITTTEPSRSLLRAIVDTPWAILPATLTRIVEAVRSGDIEPGQVLALDGPQNGAVRVGSVSVVPVYGVIEHRADWVQELFGGTSVETIRTMLRSQLADPTVRAIILDIDSPGGTAAGIAELGDEIRGARGGSTPIVAVANTLAASAAYWLGSQADEISVTPSGSVGSIGVISVHQEISRMLDEIGVTTTVITAGEHKGEANQFEPLSAEARTMLQDRVDTFYGMFKAAVAKGRRTTMDKVEADYGGGRVLSARPALAAGMVDRIETVDAAIARVSQAIVRPSRRIGASIALPDLEVSAIGRHTTDTSDGAWDGPANESRLPSGDGAETALRKAHAWVDDEGDPSVKESYKFIHHEVDVDGTVGAANLTGCSSGIAVLNGGRGGANIPDADRAGVHAHLAGHLRDAGQEPPPLTGQAPFTERVSAFALEAERVAEAASHRARSRVADHRPPFSTTTERALRASRDALDLLLSGEPGVQPGEPAPSTEAQPRPPAPVLPTISVAEFRARLKER